MKRQRERGKQGDDRGKGTYHDGARGRLLVAEATTKLGRVIGARRTTTVVWGRRCRTVGSTYTGVVLRTAPRQTDAGVANRVSLHLVDGHLSSVAVDELDKATALSRRDLDVGDLAEALEEGAELILGHVARQATNENSGVVGVGELVQAAVHAASHTTSHAARHTAAHATHTARRTAGTRLHAATILVGVESLGRLLHAPARSLHRTAHHGTAMTAAVVVWVLVAAGERQD